MCVRLTAVVSEGEVGALAGEAEAVRGRLLVFIRRSHDSDHLREEKKKKTIQRRILVNMNRKLTHLFDALTERAD